MPNLSVAHPETCRSWIGDPAAVPFFTRRYPFRRKTDDRSAFGLELAANVALDVADVPVHGALADAFDQTPNVHKMAHYLPVCEANLPRDRPIPECFGDRSWPRGGCWLPMSAPSYLHPESAIVGIDIDPETKPFDAPDNRIHVRIGSQADTEFDRPWSTSSGKKPYEAILDDGSHMASHMVESFRYLFPHALAAGGTYIVEGIDHTTCRT